MSTSDALEWLAVGCLIVGAYFWQGVALGCLAGFVGLFYLANSREGVALRVPRIPKRSSGPVQEEDRGPGSTKVHCVICGAVYPHGASHECAP